MHMGTGLLLGAAVIAIPGVAVAFAHVGKKSCPPVLYVIWVVGMIALAAGIVLSVLAFAAGVATKSCEVAASDYDATFDYSWLRGCRTSAVVDGQTVLVPFDKFRFYSDLELERTQP